MITTGPFVGNASPRISMRKWVRISSHPQRIIRRYVHEPIAGTSNASLEGHEVAPLGEASLAWVADWSAIGATVWALDTRNASQMRARGSHLLP